MASAGHAADTILLELGLLAEQDLAIAQAEFIGASVFDPEQLPDSAVAEPLVPSSFLKSSWLIPVAIDEEKIVVAAARPLEQQPVQALAYFLDRKVEVRVARRDDWEKAFVRLYEHQEKPSEHDIEADPRESTDERDIERLKDFAREAPVIKFMNKLIGDAVERAASDIHIEPLADKVQIRLRIDGILQVVQMVERSLHAGVVSRIKILARLNIAERRLPQDGRLCLPVKGREVDFRVSTVPTLHGESVVLRVLDRSDVKLDMASLGFNGSTIDILLAAINQPNGIVLVSGPTGSGKTTTLYAAVQELRTAQRKILTIEDPVEYHLNGIMQTPVKHQIGLDFAAGLRAFLRQDPDVIMVGEIRDPETARIAVQASLTGHLVLSTVHANSAASSVTRLLDMGIEAYLLAPTLRAVVAQRLVRKLCKDCRRATVGSIPSRPKMELRGPVPSRLYTAVGCQACGGTGYRGRTVLHEVMTVSPKLREILLQHPSSSTVEQAAREQGMNSLLETGLAKAAAGVTSLEEVLRVAAVE
jgi:general secretion pathway protein E